MKENLYQIRGTKVKTLYPTKLTTAECRLVFSLQRLFQPEHILADLYLPKPTSNPTTKINQNLFITASSLLQIDCIAINHGGIFVFESKDYAGWIYGHGNRIHWTQVLNYGKDKHQFYNPVKQNESHVKVIKDLFSTNIPIYSVIVFGREATLKVLTDIPDHCRVCTQSDISTTINSLTQIHPNAINAQEIAYAYALIQQDQIDPTAIIRTEHIDEVQNVQHLRP